MRKLKTGIAGLVVAAVAFAPAGIATASNSHAGQHGNHCGLNHSKHVKGQKGLKIGQNCDKTQGHGHS